MLHILLLILKILGILILVILGLLVLLAGILLFVPVRYRLEGKKMERPEGRLLVSWLFRLVSLQAVYDRRLQVTAKVFGRRLFEESFFGEEASGNSEGAEEDFGPFGDDFGETFAGLVDTPGEGSGREKQGRDIEQGSEERQEKFENPPETKNAVKSEEQKGLSGQIKSENPPEMKNSAKSEEQEGPKRRGKSGNRSETEKSPPIKESTESQEETEQKGFEGGFKKAAGRFERILEKIQGRCRGICRAGKKAERYYHRIQEFWDNQENKDTIRLVWAQVKKLLIHVLPKRLKGWVKFGFDDPYWTGQVLTAVSPFYGLYAKNFDIIPIFGERILEGEISIKGRLRAGTLLLIGFRVLLNKNFRKLLRKWRHRA